MSKDKNGGSDKDKPKDGGRHDVTRDGETGKKPQDIDPKNSAPTRTRSSGECDR